MRVGWPGAAASRYNGRLLDSPHDCLDPVEQLAYQFVLMSANVSYDCTYKSIWIFRQILSWWWTDPVLCRCTLLRLCFERRPVRFGCGILELHCSVPDLLGNVELRTLLCWNIDIDFANVCLLATVIVMRMAVRMAVMMVVLVLLGKAIFAVATFVVVMMTVTPTVGRTFDLFVRLVIVSIRVLARMCRCGILVMPVTIISTGKS